MSPVLRNIVLNGASRHRLSKGFLLLQKTTQPVTEGERHRLVTELNRYFQTQPNFAGFSLEARSGSTCEIGLATPFLPVHTADERDEFIHKLSQAVSVLLQNSERYQFLRVAAGVCG